MQGFRSSGHGLEGAAAVGNIGITAIVETRERSANVDDWGSTAVGADVEQIIESALREGSKCTRAMCAVERACADTINGTLHTRQTK